MGSVDVQVLQNDIKKLQSQVAALSASVNAVTAPVNPSSKDKVNQANLSSTQIIDVLWNSVFYFDTFFESLDGWNTLAGNSAPTESGLGVQIKTDSTSGHTAIMAMAPYYQNVLSYDRPSKFRTSFQLSSITSMNFSAGIGDCAKTPIFASDTRHYGFRVENGSLLGVVGNGTSETTIVLGPVLASITEVNIYFVEARLTPGVAVDFTVTKDGSPLYNNRITTNIPKGPFIGNNLFSAWITYEVVTNSAASVAVEISQAEYIQQRLYAKP